MSTTIKARAVPFKAIQNRRMARPVKIYPSMTTPNLTLSIEQLIQRSLAGTLTQKPLQGVYYNGKHPEMSGFENMDAVEKMQVVKKVAEKARENMGKFKKEVQEHKKEQERLRLENIKSDAIAAHEAAKKAN